ncbi:hypothetical protein ACJX0J_016989, partial [Zea mays]
VTLIKEEMMQEKIAQGKAQGPNKTFLCNWNNGINQFFVALIKKRFFLFTEGTTMEDNFDLSTSVYSYFNMVYNTVDFFAEIPRILSPNMWFLVIHLKEIGYSKGHLEQENEFTRGNCLKKLGLKPNLVQQNDEVDEATKEFIIKNSESTADQNY